MTKELRSEFEAILKANDLGISSIHNKNGSFSTLDAMYTAYNSRKAEIEALQDKITEYAALLMDYEEKFDVIAENEAKRMIEFGEAVKRQAISWVVRGAPLATIQKDIRQIDLKQIYTNYKRK